MPASFKQSANFADTVQAALQQAGGYITKSVNDRMHEAMVEVRDAAKALAPVDHGNLEDSIKLDNSNQRRQWSVYVDMDMPDDTGKYTVGDYAVEMHEGHYIPGPKTQAKGPEAGRKFLENPFRQIIDQQLIGELEDLVRNPSRDALGRFNSSGGDAS